MSALLSRRNFLFAAATAAVPLHAVSEASAVSAGSVAAAGRPSHAVFSSTDAPASPDCTPSATAPGSMHATGTLGSLRASVTVAVLKDNVAMRYRLTNISDQQDTYTVSYTDEVSTFGSRGISYTLAPGASRHGVLYGTISHQFMFYADLSDGSTLALGPLNRLPYCELSRHKRPKPIYQPPTRHHS